MNEQSSNLSPVCSVKEQVSGNWGYDLFSYNPERKEIVHYESPCICPDSGRARFDAREMDEKIYFHSKE